MSSQTTDGTVRMGAFPAQQQLLRSRAAVAAFVGGYGSGKTRGGCYKALQLGVLNAPCVGLWVEPTYPMVRDVAMRSFEGVMQELGVPYRLHSTDHWARVADSFDILFRSGDRPERLVGINAGWAVIDEPAMQEEEVAKIILSRLRDPRAKLRQLVLTGTPEGFNWFQRWATREGTDLIRARSTDNPFLDPAYISKMREMYTEEEVAAYIDGEFIRFEGGWYPAPPPVLPHTDLFGMKCYRQPEHTSGQLVIGVDSAGGLDLDSSAVAVLDKADLALCASWTSATATVDMLCEQVQRAYLAYTAPPARGMALVKGPAVVVETNGIGRYTYQVLTGRLGVPCVEFRTTEDRRYRALLASRAAVSSGALQGPSELHEEAKLLVVKDGRFRGPKDLSMACGFALCHVQDAPYRPPPGPPVRTVSFARALNRNTRF